MKLSVIIHAAGFKLLNASKYILKFVAAMLSCLFLLLPASSVKSVLLQDPFHNHPLKVLYPIDNWTIYILYKSDISTKLARLKLRHGKVTFKAKVIWILKY